MTPRYTENPITLLREWLDTSFFETRDDWDEWVEQFRPRVETAIREDFDRCREIIRLQDRVEELTESRQYWHDLAIAAERMRKVQ